MAYQPLHTPLRTTKTFTAEQVEHLAGLIELVAAANTLEQLYQYQLREGLADKIPAGTATANDFIYLWAYAAMAVRWGLVRWSAKERLTHGLYAQIVWDRFDDYFLAMDAAHATD